MPYISKKTANFPANVGWFVNSDELISRFAGKTESLRLVRVPYKDTMALYGVCQTGLVIYTNEGGYFVAKTFIGKDDMSASKRAIYDKHIGETLSIEDYIY